MADKLAAAGYKTIQSPTEGPSPALTTERMQAEGLEPGKDPDLLIENRVFDTYTPVQDNTASILKGIESKVDTGQTQRVVVDLRNTTQSEASLRAALRADPISGLKEVVTITDNGLGRFFRP